MSITFINLFLTQDTSKILTCRASLFYALCAPSVLASFGQVAFKVSGDCVVDINPESSWQAS